MPSVGWHAACAACGANLTQRFTEYAQWAEIDGAENDAENAEFEASSCPACDAAFGDREADDE